MLPALTGCAAFETALDFGTDPRVLQIIDTLRALVDAYQIRLNDPLLESHHRLDTQDHFDEFAGKVEVQLNLLEQLGYQHRADRWRAKLDLPARGHS